MPVSGVRVAGSLLVRRRTRYGNSIQATRVATAAAYWSRRRLAASDARVSTSATAAVRAATRTGITIEVMAVPAILAMMKARAGVMRAS